MLAQAVFTKLKKTREDDSNSLRAAPPQELQGRNAVYCKRHRRLLLGPAVPAEQDHTRSGTAGHNLHSNGSQT
jgi:hypothetical protein